MKLDELFVSWLAQPETRDAVRKLIVDIKACGVACVRARGGRGA